MVCGKLDRLHEILPHVVDCQWPGLIVYMYTRPVVRLVGRGCYVINLFTRLFFGTTRLRTCLGTLCHHSYSTLRLAATSRERTTVDDVVL